MTFWVAVWITVGTAAYLVYGNRPTTLPVLLHLRAFYRVQESARRISRLLGTMLLWPVFVALVLERDPWLAVPYLLLAPLLLIVGSVYDERANRFVLGVILVLVVVLSATLMFMYPDTD
jgi:hypothetical protein